MDGSDGWMDGLHPAAEDRLSFRSHDRKWNKRLLLAASRGPPTILAGFCFLLDGRFPRWPLGDFRRWMCAEARRRMSFQFTSRLLTINNHHFLG